jgi:cytochrome oxidase Cu insertion factor (SCO1/SenC/PrrC family)
MDDTSQRLSRTIWIGVGLVIVLICVAYVLSNVQPRHKQTAVLPVINTVADFTLMNQNNRTVTLDDLRGHVWVADIIFTRCAGPCPRMTQQMKSLQDILPPGGQTRLVTLTTDPEFDTPEILQRYAARFGANPERWTFLTGTKKEIARLAIDELKLTAVEKDPNERTDPADLFIHSTIFVVVDKEARLRMVFETTGDGIEWTNVQPNILAAVRQLEAER